MASSFLKSIRQEYLRYKTLGEQAVAQLSDDDLHWKPHASCNSVAVIMQHIAGNTLSRFTEFLTTDGEKGWRDRDAEFVEQFTDRENLLKYWEKGWTCLFDALDELTDDDLEQTVYVRNEPHSVIEALNRSMGHHAYHVGQMVHIGIQLKGDDWKTLSVPRGESKQFNEMMFAKNKQDYA